MKSLAMPLSFKVYVDPKGRFYKPKTRKFYRVFLFREAAAMYVFADAARKRLGYPRLAHSYGGVTMGFSHADPKHPGLCGFIMLGGRYLSMAGVVSHEMAHAAHYIALPLMESKRRGLVAFPDEKIAWLQGEFVRQFWVHWWNLKKRGKIRVMKGVK